jgi:hypothetical protein
VRARGPVERVTAWAITGPPGHVWSAFADIVALLARYWLARLRGRSPAG